MPRKKKTTTAPKIKEVKAVEAAPAEEVVVEVSAEEKPVEAAPVEKITTAPAEEVVIVEEVPAPAPEKKKATRRTSAKKTAEKKPVEKAAPEKKTAEKTTKATKTAKTTKPAAHVEEKAPVEKKTTTRKTTVNVFFEGNGYQSSELVEKAKELAGIASPKSVRLYIKPEDGMVYYVVDDVNGGFAL